MNLKDHDHLKYIIKSAPIDIAILDAGSFKIEMLNDKFLEIIGKPESGIIGKWHWKLFPDARNYYETALSRVSKNGEAYYTDEAELIRTRHGAVQVIYGTFVYAPVKNESGEISKIAAWLLENTRQTKAQEAADANEKRFRELVNATSDVVYSLSADWEIMRPLDGRGFLKDTHEPITGWRKQNVHPDHMEMVNKAIAGAILDKKIFQLEHKVVRTDGSAG